MRRVLPTSFASFLPLAVAIACGTGVPTVDVLPLADTTDTVGPYEITAVIAESDRITAARVVWFTGDAAAPKPVPFVRQDASDRWKAELPGQPGGSTVRWRVEVETDEGDLVRMPAGENDDSFPTWTFRVVPAL